MFRPFHNPAVATAMALLCIVAFPVSAQNHVGPVNRRPPARPARPERPQKTDQLERLQKMTPAERQKALEKLPPERKKALEQRLDQYGKLSADEKARFQKFNELPAERQQTVRQAIGKLTKLPAERQQVVREELKQMQGMAPAAREARTSSEEFREKYSPQEQQLIEQLRDVVPE